MYGRCAQCYRSIVGPLTTHREVGKFCYLLHRLLGPQCPLVEALRPQAVDAIDEEYAYFSLQMAKSHHCTLFAYDVSCIIGNYLNAYVKALATVLLTDPGGLILVYFQYLKEKIIHSRYVGRPPPPYLGTLLLTCDTEREAAAGRIREPAPGSVNSGHQRRIQHGHGKRRRRRQHTRAAPYPGQWGPKPPTPCPIQRLRLLPAHNHPCGMCRNNRSLYPGGGAEFCKR